MKLNEKRKKKYFHVITYGTIQQIYSCYPAIHSAKQINSLKPNLGLNFGCKFGLKPKFSVTLFLH